MSDPIKDGGPAFPGGISATPKASDDAPPTQAGMTLRDYFAGQALAGILSNHELFKLTVKTGIHSEETADMSTAYASYGLADAMLVAREAKL